jgi:predicted DNA-binding protein
MENKQSQIKINLSTGLKEMVEKRAKKYGATLAGYAKYLMMKDIEESEDLRFSDETLKNIKLAKNGKAKWYEPTSINDLDRLVDSVK